MVKKKNNDENDLPIEVELGENGMLNLKKAMEDELTGQDRHQIWLNSMFKYYSKKSGSSRKKEEQKLEALEKEIWHKSQKCFDFS